jgi:formylglycine-generating enzyme required for sulfatase activity
MTHDAIAREITTQMVMVDAGEIALKDEGKDLRWAINLQPFRISKFVVTRAQYDLLVRGLVVETEESQKPVVEVSWQEATQFCNLLSRQAGLAECYSWDATGVIACDWNSSGYRLPSEAEWEFACRAGSSDVRYGELDDIAWYNGNSSSQLHEVGLKQPNNFGLYDTIGNVWEWCWDIYDSEVYGEYRVFRGGGFSDPPRGCRASCRRKSHPTFRIDDLSFRLEQTIF